MGFSGIVNAGLQMGLESLVVRVNRSISGITYIDDTGTQQSLDDVVAQAWIEEEFQDTLEITEHPVSKGAAIADHAYKIPPEVTLHMGWSLSPSSAGSMVSAAVAAAAANNSTVNAVANAYGLAQAGLSILNGSALGDSQYTDSLSAIYARLVAIQENRALFSVYAGKRYYENMVCKSLVVHNDYKTENSLFVTMVCKKVLLVNSHVVQNSQSMLNPQEFGPRIDSGAKNIIQTTPNAAQTSWLAGLT